MNKHTLVTLVLSLFCLSIAEIESAAAKKCGDGSSSPNEDQFIPVEPGVNFILNLNCTLGNRLDTGLQLCKCYKCYGYSCTPKAPTDSMTISTPSTSSGSFIASPGCTLGASYSTSEHTCFCFKSIGYNCVKN